MSKKETKTLVVDAKQIVDGIVIKVLGKDFKIKYPKEIWQKTPLMIRKALLENIAFAETHYLPLVLNKTKLKYKLNYPLLEPSFFKIQLFDMLDCEDDDKVKHLSYLRRFYNLEFQFESPDSTYLDPARIPKFNSYKPKAIIPFSFGKESLVTFALCRELGIEPILVYCQEPAHPYEEKYKLKKLKEFQKKFKVKVFFIKHEPGLFRYGKAFNKKKKTEIGWGTQATLLALLVIPFVYAFRASYIFFGSEYLNNKVQIIRGWKMYISIDQTSEATALTNNLVRLLTNNQCQVKSSLEPLESISIFYMLHHRYPEIGKYQFSCYGLNPLYGKSQWCHRCTACLQMFLFASFCNLNPKNLGFKKDLFQNPNLFDYFSAPIRDFSPEWDFAFYWLYKKGQSSPCIEMFKRTKLSKLKSELWFNNFFFKTKPPINLPHAYEKKMMQIFKEELKSFRKHITSFKT